MTDPLRSTCRYCGKPIVQSPHGQYWIHVNNQGQLCKPAWLATPLDPEMADDPAIGATLLEGNVWLRADDLVVWALSGQSEAGRELASKIGQVITRVRQETS